MSDAIIQVEGLGKKYRLRHQAERQRYVALRDVIADKTKSMVRGLWSRSQLSSVPRTEDFWALRDVSFEVKKGEVLGIIGRNGAGKSTLLKILSRITEPTAGLVRIRGRVASLLEVGTGFHPELTGRENISLNGAILGMHRAEIKKKFGEIVAFADIEKFLDTPVKHFSSGMYVRLAFAVAAHLEPEILVVDEVLAVGDAQFQKKCLGKMSEVAQAGRTVLFVSHNMPMVQAFCRRVVLLEAGHLVQDGLPDRIIPLYLRQGLSSAGSIVNLKAHPGRRNSQEPVLIRAWLETAEHQIANAILMGEAVFFCFEFECSAPIASPTFGFGIEDSLGRRVFSMNNVMNRSTSNSPPMVERGIARLFVRHNPLLPGTYFLSVSLMKGQHTWVDFVEQAITFRVEASDVYGSGSIPLPTHGTVFVDGEIQYVGKA